MQNTLPPAVTSLCQHDKHNTVYKAKSLLTGLQDATYAAASSDFIESA